MNTQKATRDPLFGVGVRDMVWIRSSFLLFIGISNSALGIQIKLEANELTLERVSRVQVRLELSNADRVVVPFDHKDARNETAKEVEIPEGASVVSCRFDWFHKVNHQDIVPSNEIYNDINSFCDSTDVIEIRPKLVAAPLLLKMRKESFDARQADQVLFSLATQDPKGYWRYSKVSKTAMRENFELPLVLFVQNTPLYLGLNTRWFKDKKVIQLDPEISLVVEDGILEIK